MTAVSNNERRLKYVAALALFDGSFDIRPGKNYSVIIADLNKAFLQKLQRELEKVGVKSTLRPGTRDRAWRLRIYGKEIVLHLKELADKVLRNPDDTLLAAAIDAEGSIVTQTDQPLRIRITLKEGEKAEAVRKALEKTGVQFKAYRRCRKRGQCHYVEFVISNKRNVRTLLEKVEIMHPIKLKKIYSRLGGPSSPGRG